MNRSRSSSEARTASIMRLLIDESDLWMPGVSTKITWAPGECMTPWIAVRVVCGLSATMEIFWPTRVFSSVDLPAFGRPRMETKPERKILGCVSLTGGSLSGNAAQMNLDDTHVVTRGDFRAKAVTFDSLACFRHVTEPFRDQAANGSGFDFFLRVKVQHSGQPREIEIAGDDVATVAVFADVGTGFMLIANFTQDDLHDIFHGGESGGVAVFIDHDHQVRAFLLHLAQQIVYGFCFRHELDGPHQLANGSFFTVAFGHFEHVAHVDETDDVIDG